MELKNGQTFTLTTEDIVGDESRVAITYKDLPDDVKPGDTILVKASHFMQFEKIVAKLQEL